MPDKWKAYLGVKADFVNKLGHLPNRKNIFSSQNALPDWQNCYWTLVRWSSIS